MGLSCGYTVMKYLLFFFNIIFWICGAGLLGVGIWVLVDHNALQILKIATIDSDDSLVRVSAIVLVAVGGTVFLTGFLGCCGAIRESPGCLCMYAGLVCLILVLQIAAGVVAVVFQERIVGVLESSMNKTVQIRYGQSTDEGVTEAWDFMQKEFKCCGAVNGPDDWETSLWKLNMTGTSQTVPNTCCTLVDEKAADPVPINATLCYAKTEGYIWNQGCKQSLMDWVKNHSAILIGVAFGIAAIQALGILVACCLKSNLHKGYEYV